MSKPLFTLEVLNAKEGDCLILHYGTLTKPKFIVIDCGPRGVYQAFLKKRLQAIKDAKSPHHPLPIDLLMISHIDDDHIAGAVDWTNEMLEMKDKHQEPPFELLQLWHNSFDDLVSKKQDSFLASLAPDALSTLSVDGLAELSTWFADENGDRDGAVAASVQSGRRLRDNAKRLEMFVNPGFPRLVMTAQPPKQAKWGDLHLTILGPDADRLSALQDEWDKEIRKLRKAGKLGKAAMQGLAALAKQGEDKSPYNLSSIVVLAESHGKRMLLTGDALGKYVTEGLDKAGLMKNGKIHVDLLKMPHHGSERNVTPDFFPKITADHYVFSADGKHRNPDIGTLEMLTQSRPKDDLKFYFTNHDGKDPKTGFELGPALDKFFAKEKKRGRHHDVVYRNPAQDKLAHPETLQLSLGARLNY